MQKVIVLLMIIIPALSSGAMAQKHKNVLAGRPGLEAYTIPLSRGAVFDVILVDPRKCLLEFFHQDEQGDKIATITKLKQHLEKKSRRLLFAVNGGMYNKDLSPVGIYVENGTTIFPLNMEKGGPAFSNFYSIRHNGVFYIDEKGQPGILDRAAFARLQPKVKFATQSGPMIKIDGQTNPDLRKASKSRFIRSGVGITQQGKILFVISKEKVNFYEFSRMFAWYGCRNALYLDGVVSEMYLPQLKRKQTTNAFALMIGISELVE